MLPEMSPTRASQLPSLSTNRGLRQFLMKTLNVPKFRGVFACDLMPVLKPGESAILNTDPHTLPGRHYICLRRINKNQYELFDSLSADLSTMFPLLTQELKRRDIYHKIRKVNTSPIQHYNSHMCGLFCVDFILGRAFPTYRDFSHPFQRQTSYNDVIVISNILHWVTFCLKTIMQDRHDAHKS